jgi:hypothetical protein
MASGMGVRRDENRVELEDAIEFIHFTQIYSLRTE